MKKKPRAKIKWKWNLNKVKRILFLVTHCSSQFSFMVSSVESNGSEPKRASRFRWLFWLNAISSVRESRAPTAKTTIWQYKNKFHFFHAVCKSLRWWIKHFDKSWHVWMCETVFYFFTFGAVWNSPTGKTMKWASNDDRVQAIEQTNTQRQRRIKRRRRKQTPVQVT